MAVLALAVVLALAAQARAAFPILPMDGSSAFDPVICAHYASPVGRLPMDLISLINKAKYNYTYGATIGTKKPLKCGGNGSGVGRASVVGCPYAFFDTAKTSTNVCSSLASASAYNTLPKNTKGQQVLGARPLGFGDGQFVIKVGAFDTIPPQVIEIPLAYGAIAIYINDPQLDPARNCLSVKALCQIFGTTSITWPTALPGATELASTPMLVYYRSTSSGSTGAVAFYLRSAGVCNDPIVGVAVNYQTPLANNPPTSVPGNWRPQATTTTLLAALTSGAFGGVGYASCQFGLADAPPAIREVPVENLVGVCTICRGCSPANQPAGPGASIEPYCADYTRFIVTSSFNKTGNNCDWTGVIVDGDKDADGDGGNDTDKDLDGIKPGYADYPMVFLEFGYLNNVAPVSATPNGLIAKTMMLTILTAAFQGTLPSFGYQPVSSVITTSACKCLKTYVAKGAVLKGIYTAGKCT